MFGVYPGQTVLPGTLIPTKPVPRALKGHELRFYMRYTLGLAVQLRVSLKYTC